MVLAGTRQQAGIVLDCASDPLGPALGLGTGLALPALGVPLGDALGDPPVPHS
jgi:hypothetical protein